MFYRNYKNKFTLKLNDPEILIFHCDIFKFEESTRQANEALRDLMELVNMPEFEDHDGWKKKISLKNDVVYSKRYKLGKFFTMRASFIVVLF